MNEQVQNTPVADKTNGHKVETTPNGHDPCIYPVGNYRVFRLDPTDSYSSKFIYQFVIRALQFIEKYGTETDQRYLVNKIYDLFTPQNKNWIHLLVAVNHKEEIVAHCLSLVEPAGKLGWVIQLLQVENDVAEPRIQKFGMRLIEEWRQSIGIKTVLTTTLSDAITRYDKRYGFKTFRTVMIKQET